MYTMIEDNIFEICCDGQIIKPGDKIILKDNDTIIDIVRKTFKVTEKLEDYCVAIKKIQGIPFTFSKATKFKDDESEQCINILHFEINYNRIKETNRYWALTDEMFKPYVITDNTIPDLFGNNAYGEMLYQ